MKFEEDHNEANYKISGYDNSSIGINGIAYHQSLILSPLKLISDCDPSDYSLLEVAHLDQFYKLDPEVILLGSGDIQIFPPPEILKRLAQEKVGFEIMDTQAACRTFNILMAEGRNVVAGLFIS